MLAEKPFTRLAPLVAIPSACGRAASLIAGH
jgi:hypothetical protein